MKTITYALFVLIVAASAYYIGGQQNQVPDTQVTTDLSAGLEQTVRDMPRGGLGIPAQWFMMESLVGWEKMMLIFGYADNRDVCLSMLDIAKEDSPDRDFRCEDAN